MKSQSKMLNTLLGSLLVAGLFSSTVHAETMRSSLRQGVQMAGQNQFQRQIQVTTGQGATATRSVEGRYDADNKSYTRSLEGSRLNGASYASSRETIKTDSGFERNLSRTNAAGETATANSTVVRDTENKSVSKEVQATGFNGQTYSTTITRSLGASGS